MSGRQTDSVVIEDEFWSPRLHVNRERAIFYQWERYEQRGTIDNFRIAAGLKQGPRKGFFYTDSDLHKWAEAASGIVRTRPEARVRELLDKYVALMAVCQEPDGYLFTYNQINFPGTRWKNLQIEHELYCHGHFIEAGIAHHLATGSDVLLTRARAAADLIVREFLRAPAVRTSGHQEIEIALIRLYRLTGTMDYLETARAVLERRGRIPFFAAHFTAQVLSQMARSRAVARRNRNEGSAGFQLGENRTKKEPPFIMMRSLRAFLTGTYQQQHAPLRKQPEPRGHAVRWAYMMRAAAMLYRETGDATLARFLKDAWERLAETKMYVTGGLGALPVIEGFGRPFELDNRYSYSETCAAIGSVLWNEQMSLATGEARYADLMEWQLFNAVLVGMSLSGDSYFYRNPLASDGTLERQGWFATACCPSNISRLLADLDRLIYTRTQSELRVEQYIGNRADFGHGVCIRMTSELPWQGKVVIIVKSPAVMSLSLRTPGWAEQGRVRVNGEESLSFQRIPESYFGKGCFQRAGYLSLTLPAGEAEIQLDFTLAITLRAAHPRVRTDSGRVAVTRGPLVYCLESTDTPGVDPSSIEIARESLRFVQSEGLIHGIPGMIEGVARDGSPVRLVPYSLWGNRGPSAMAVWLRAVGHVIARK